MIKFTKPTNLNGAGLRDELNAGGVVIGNHVDAVKLDGDGFLWLDISDADKVKANKIVSAHNGIMIAPDTSAAKTALFDKLGITADEAVLLLS